MRWSAILDERPRVKFSDADLVGIPLRVVVGKGYVRVGDLEVQVRRDDSRSELPPGQIGQTARDKLDELFGTQ